MPTRPLVASYCTTFLKPEMLHIYRQVTGLQRYRTFILAKERLCEDRYPFEEIELLPSPPRWNWLRYAWLKYARRAPQLDYRGELPILLDRVERRAPALVHIYFGHTGAHLLPFVQRWTRPCIVSFHGADVMVREDRRDYPQQLLALFDAVPLVLARSHSLARRLEELGCPPEKLRINRTGIPLDQFPLAQRAWPVDGAWRLVQTCRLIPKKGLRTALQAFARFRDRYPKATFTIAGEGPMFGELQALAGELGIAEAVTFPGFLDQKALQALYAASHLFLHPSETTARQDQEGVPNAMLEAMATGLPVVATQHGGIPEAVAHGESGFLVPERDPEALAAALEEATVEERWRQWSHGAAQGVRKEFEWRSAVAKLEAFYDEAIATP